ncbi:protein BUNDLE SHEATH DEFECTIVE 2, chloroplastic-like [Ziziphus jujuba]|uniref:Protein BUNDLE SHEATH DEFECTIVE 2, chloroplastic-like n=1 Tax=Ziziphus jujuba TaxID=326968 RepID=A0ABM3ILX3_ZIZJJ|nr:protein BUNDLE SHEATH DEFECTIVE 2, chloroplastic-like [Ziziphus jujuba]
MACLLCSAPVNSMRATLEPDNHGNLKLVPRFNLLQNFPAAKLGQVKAKGVKDNKSTKPNSVICPDCGGNGAVLCSQCKGSGVNSIDFFNGQFKAGDSCWLCGGKKDMLCGNCNGAGFVGGFMSTFDE